MIEDNLELVIQMPTQKIFHNKSKVICSDSGKKKVTLAQFPLAIFYFRRILWLNINLKYFVPLTRIFRAVFMQGSCTKRN